jgi:hypothetical protein
MSEQTYASKNVSKLDITTIFIGRDRIYLSLPMLLQKDANVKISCISVRPITKFLLFAVSFVG